MWGWMASSEVSQEWLLALLLRRRVFLSTALLVALSGFAPPAALAQDRLPAAEEPAAALLVTVVDENGVAVPSARLLLTPHGTQAAFRGEPDYAGRHRFVDLPPGRYSLRVEKENFYALPLDDVRLGELESVEITLNHVREFTEVVQVVASPPGQVSTGTPASRGEGRLLDRNRTNPDGHRRCADFRATLGRVLSDCQ